MEKQFIDHFFRKYIASHGVDVNKYWPTAGIEWAFLLMCSQDINRQLN